MSMNKFNSMAGTDKQYFGNDDFRIRKSDGGVRLHIPRTHLRERDKYVAIDFSNNDFVAALVAAGLVKAEPVTKYVTKTVMVPQEVTEEVTELAVVAS